MQLRTLSFHIAESVWTLFSCGTSGTVEFEPVWPVGLNVRSGHPVISLDHVDLTCLCRGTFKPSKAHSFSTGHGFGWWLWQWWVSNAMQEAGLHLLCWPWICSGRGTWAIKAFNQVQLSGVGKKQLQQTVFLSHSGPYIESLIRND